MSKDRLDSINFSYNFKADQKIGDLIKAELVEMISNNPYFLFNGILFDISSYEIGVYSVHIEINMNYITLSPFKLDKIFTLNKSEINAKKKVEPICILITEVLDAYGIKLIENPTYFKPLI